MEIINSKGLGKVIREEVEETSLKRYEKYILLVSDNNKKFNVAVSKYPIKLESLSYVFPSMVENLRAKRKYYELIHRSLKRW